MAIVLIVRVVFTFVTSGRAYACARHFGRGDTCRSLASVRKSRPSTQPFIAKWLSADADVRQGMKQPKNIQEPEHDGNHHDAVQDGLDVALHGDKAIHQP